MYRKNKTDDNSTTRFANSEALKLHGITYYRAGQLNFEIIGWSFGQYLITLVCLFYFESPVEKS